MNLTFDMLYKVSHKSSNMDEEFISVFAYIRQFTNDKELKYWCEKMYVLLQAVYEHTGDLYNRLHPEPKERGPEHAEWMYKNYERINTRYQYIFDKLIETNPKYLKAKKDLMFKEKLDKINDMF